MADELSLRCAGGQALIAYLHGDDPEAVSRRVQTLAAALEQGLGDLLVDLVPSYASLLVSYDALRTDHYQLSRRIRALARAGGAASTGAAAERGRLLEVPTYYAPESGADLEVVAAHGGLAVGELIALHSGREYRVYAIGFAPGFAYLGSVDPRLAMPRLSTPRQRVPRGAVAIADRQTAIYPADSPGGWHLIGRTALRMFDPAADPPVPVRVGDRVRFRPVSRADYLAAGGQL